jgi:hypothetical protein
VLNEEYATKIARDWNVRQSGAGYVTCFQVRRSFLDRYEVRQVGGQTILEYWIPAEDPDALNASIVCTIKGDRGVPLTAITCISARRSAAQPVRRNPASPARRLRSSDGSYSFMETA